MSTLQYIAAAKSRLGIESDYALAKKLNVTRSYVSKIQSGNMVVSDKTACQLAEILDINPARVVIAAHAERETDPKMQAVWAGLLSKISEGFNVFGSGYGPHDRRVCVR